MITVKVLAHKGQPPSQPLSADFDELGGGIGRGEGNTLILPDPERHISRTQAIIVFRAGRYIIQDRGSATPVYVNGRALGNGHESPIAAGDEVRIAAYTLGVTEAALPASRPGPAPGLAKDDPLALFGAGASPTDPFADLMAQPPAAGEAPAKPAAALMDDPFATPAPKAGQGGAIPSDFDPFANLGAPSASAPGKATLPEDLDLGLGPSPANRSIDDLFGLEPSSGADLLAPGSPLGESLGPSGESSSTDPLAAFGGAPAAKSSPPQRNDTPELHGAFRPPEARPDPALMKPAPPPDVPRPAAAEPNMVLSWDENGAGTGEIKTMIIGTRRREPEGPPPAENAAVDPLALFGGTPVSDPLGIREQAPSAPARAKPSLPARDAAPAARPVSSTAPKPVAVPAAARPGSAQDELLQAFLQGAGVPDLNIPGGLTPQAMRMLGELLREAMQGTLDLLLARATIKREIRAEMTLIVARENNPLKFSPNVEAALAHLLAPQARGFMPPVEAMRNAFDDLRSHQFGFMAGVRAALAGVLLRFNPEQLEARLTQKTVIDSLLPMNRKAKLWDLFQDLYGDISKEAEEDFHALFGKEFLRAYEAQVEKLEEDDKGAAR